MRLEFTGPITTRSQFLVDILDRCERLNQLGGLRTLTTDGIQIVVRRNPIINLNFFSSMCMHVGIRNWLRYLFREAQAVIVNRDTTPAALLRQLYVLCVSLSYVHGGTIPKGVVPYDRLDLIRHHIKRMEEWGVVTLDPPRLLAGEMQNLIKEYVYLKCSYVFCPFCVFALRDVT